MSSLPVSSRFHKSYQKPDRKGGRRELLVSCAGQFGIEFDSLYADKSRNNGIG